MLIADPDGEQFWPGQSRQVYDGLQSPKTLVRFTVAEGADLHCEPLALDCVRSGCSTGWIQSLRNARRERTQGLVCRERRSGCGATGSAVRCRYLRRGQSQRSECRHEEAWRGDRSVYRVANIFFVSLAELLPSHAELVTMIIAVLSIYNVTRESEAMRRRFPELSAWRCFGLFRLASISLNSALPSLSLKIASQEKLGLVHTVFGLYSYALRTSWRLLGLRD